jgi:hypothetical protein
MPAGPPHRHWHALAEPLNPIQVPGVMGVASFAKGDPEEEVGRPGIVQAFTAM